MRGILTVTRSQGGLLLGCLAVALAPSLTSAQSTNLALGGTATQSSNYVTTGVLAGLAGNGNDGDTDGSWHAGSVTHTDNLPDSWWQVDLGAVYSFHTLRIYNRSDCCGTRLSNFRVRVERATVEIFGQDFFLGTGSVPLGGVLDVPLPPGTSGDTVAIQFLGLNNDGNGYLSITELEVLTGGISANYCPLTPNSAGAGAAISFSGSASVAANDLGFLSGPMAAGEPGIFYYGPDQVQVPFGNGNRCVGGGPGTIVRMFPFAIADASGFMNYTLDNTGSAHGQIVPGATLNFQAWFRDPLGGGAGFNLSNGLSLTFAP